MKKLIEVDIKLSPQQLAQEWCEMGADEQAEFFNEIRRQVSTWTRSFCFQFAAICRAEELSDGGREIMREIGAYAYHKEEANDS